MLKKSKNHEAFKGITVLGGVTRLIRSGIINWRPSKFFKNINDTISREENKTIYSGLRITGMALPNQSKLPAFFSPRQVNLKIRHPPPTILEDDLSRMANSRRWPTENGQISEDYLPKLAKNLGSRQAGTGQAAERQLQWSAVSPISQFAIYQ